MQLNMWLLRNHNIPIPSDMNYNMEASMMLQGLQFKQYFILIYIHMNIFSFLVIVITYIEVK